MRGQGDGGRGGGGGKGISLLLQVCLVYMLGTY